MFDFSHPWYQPRARRIGVVVVCVLWFAMEARSGNPFWMMLAGAVTVLTVWKLLISFPQAPKE